MTDHHRPRCPSHIIDKQTLTIFCLSYHRQYRYSVPGSGDRCLWSLILSAYETPSDLILIVCGPFKNAWSETISFLPKSIKRRHRRRSFCRRRGKRPAAVTDTKKRRYFLSHDEVFEWKYENVSYSKKNCIYSRRSVSLQSEIRRRFVQLKFRYIRRHDGEFLNIFLLHLFLVQRFVIVLLLFLQCLSLHPLSTLDQAIEFNRKKYYPKRRCR